MKKIVFLFVFIFSAYHCISQTLKGEKINWDSLQSYHSDQIIFKSDEIKMQCSDCNFVEIETTSGINGIFLLCGGTVDIIKGNISDKISGCMIRFNPTDMNTFITIKDKTKIHNRGFVAMSKNILNDSFGHCYQANLNALIPDKGNYALNMFSETYGEILASFAGDIKILYNFTERRHMFK